MERGLHDETPETGWTYWWAPLALVDTPYTGGYPLHCSPSKRSCLNSLEIKCKREDNPRSKVRITRNKVKKKKTVTLLIRVPFILTFVLPLTREKTREMSRRSGSAPLSDGTGRRTRFVWLFLRLFVETTTGPKEMLATIKI